MTASSIHSATIWPVREGGTDGTPTLAVANRPGGSSGQHVGNDIAHAVGEAAGDGPVQLALVRGSHPDHPGGAGSEFAAASVTTGIGDCSVQQGQRSCLQLRWCGAQILASGVSGSTCRLRRHGFRVRPLGFPTTTGQVALGPAAPPPWTPTDPEAKSPSSHRSITLLVVAACSRARGLPLRQTSVGGTGRAVPIGPILERALRLEAASWKSLRK